MPDFKFESAEIVAFMDDYLELPALKDDLGKLSEIDWNPFNDDADEYVGAWAEIRHNYDLIWNVVLDLVTVAERIIVGGLQLTNEQKHKSVVEALDRALDCPWYLEPFDSVALGLLVNAAVKYLNAVNWGVGEDGIMTPIVLGEK